MTSPQSIAYLGQDIRQVGHKDHDGDLPVGGVFTQVEALDGVGAQQTDLQNMRSAMSARCSNVSVDGLSNSAGENPSKILLHSSHELYCHFVTGLLVNN